MPFDFKKYDAKCATLDGDALQREWEHYTRLISGAATSTAVSGIAVPFTLGVSTIGVGLAAPAIHNARKKREIIERHLQRLGRTHHTRKRDVLTASAISGTVGVATLGLAPIGADAICNTAAEHGLSYIAENELGVKVATHLALDAAAVAAEEAHMHSKKEQEAWKAYAHAVKQGKPPPLPAPDVKIATNTYVQPVDLKQVQSTQMAPSIIVDLPLEQHASTGSTAIYFPPTPGQSGLTFEPPLDRRHSVSTLSMTAEQSFEGASLSVSNNQFMLGTTSAIYPPSRPSSAMGGEKTPVVPMGLLPAANLSPPSPPHAQQCPSEVQQALPHVHRPRAYSSASFDSLPSYEMHQQTQLVYGMSQLHLPPPPLTPSPSMPASPPSPLRTPATPMSDYFSSPMIPHKQSISYQPQPEQSPSWTPRYDPKDYATTKQQQQYTAHLLADKGKFSPGTMYASYDQKTPLLYHYQPQSPGITTPQLVNNMPTPPAATVYYTTPDPQPTFTYLPEKQVAQQTLYFPPPPKAH